MGWFKSVYFFFFLLIGSLAAKAQQTYNVSGDIVDSSGQALPGASIKLYWQSDSAVTLSSPKGGFTFQNLRSDSIRMVVTYTGMTTYDRILVHPDQNPTWSLGNIVLLPATDALAEVVVEGVKAITIKGDTVQFAASSLNVREGAAVEEMIKKLPGVSVDNDGNMETQGKKIEKIRVNGKDFFGSDAQMALQNLPADIVANIQLIDDYGDQANLTGVKTGEPRKILNINIQKNKNKGYYANGTAAIGNKGRFIGNVNANQFSDERQLTVTAASGNTGANMATGNPMGNNMGGAGITVTQLLGLNYRNKWGKKVTFYGSYFLNGRDNTTQSSTFAQDFNPSNTRITQRESDNQNNNFSHRINLNVEYQIDSFHYIKLSPNLGFTQSAATSASTSGISRKGFYTYNRNSNHTDGLSDDQSINILYNHRFKQKRGRNFSIAATLSTTDNAQDRNNQNGYHREDSSYYPIYMRDTLQVQGIDTRSDNSRTNVHISHLEPLNAKLTHFIEVSYDWNKAAYATVKDVMDYIDTTRTYGTLNTRQSDAFHYTFTTQRTGLSFRGRTLKYNYSVGMQWQPLVLEGTSFMRKFTTTYHNQNWFPAARYVYNFARNNNLTISLDGTAREPSFFQLQPISDSTNLENIIKGNPDLRNEFTNRLALQYSWANTEGASFMLNTTFDRTSDKIVASRVNNISSTGRTTSYLNTDGFYGYNLNAHYTKPFFKRAFIVSMSLAANYDNNISYTDGLKNKGNNWTLRPTTMLRVDIKNVIDLSVRSSYNMYNTTTRYVNAITSTKAQTLQLGINGKHYIKDLTLGYDYSKTMNYRFSGGNIPNPSILSLFTEYRFLQKKNLIIRCQAFDVFDKYTGLSRSIYETTITDVRTSRLGRFYLVSLNYRISKFNGKVVRSPMGGAKGNGGRRGGRG